MNTICQWDQQDKTSIRNLRQTARFSLIVVSALMVLLGTASRAIANPETVPNAPDAADIEEINTSITQDYMPAIIYLPDPNTQELVPQSVLVTADEPVAGAVTQIVESYEGQDVGITGYEVNVNEAAKEAEINFAINNPRGGRAFQSLSSANQYCLFEAIRETLLTQPSYGIQQVIFQANSVDFDI
ncbi:hypothetical protein [Thermoleptolyngbya sp. C42_A2020_037]|uniref:hypothetical protein n=1 Tax=Thermoleptolyngbya sp. C42_A2020_037 TaxID=2747799 RepID=UPI0019E523FD|nr:hypothetical protein [Thermoleptolyngbya sp. C42_A2020_037]MBF2086350.1 hypothetical protein [Thermoleptolyngbya sp. C42_A2020_037]